MTLNVLYKMRYILWVSALLGACDVNQDGGFAKLDFIEIKKLSRNGKSWKFLC